MTTPAFADIVLAELMANDVTLCRGCAERGGHKRGFVLNKQPKVIHLDRAFATRSTLHRFLHEMGHAAHDQRGMKRWQREEQAEEYARESMRKLEISVPRKVAAKGRRYVGRLKQWGGRISAGLRLRRREPEAVAVSAPNMPMPNVPADTPVLRSRFFREAA